MVFGLRTVAGMMLITVSLAPAFRLAGGRSGTTPRRLGLAFGLASIVFGAFFAYGIWLAPAVRRRVTDADATFAPVPRVRRAASTYAG